MSIAPAALKRLLKEIRTLQLSPPPGVAVQVDEADVLNVTGWIRGPVGTPFQGGYFAVQMKFTGEFPAVPPECTMVTKIFHPNISTPGGSICVSTLKKDWSPTYGPTHLLSVLCCLLISPNPDSALNPEAARLLQEDYQEYCQTAALWTSVHASRGPSGGGEGEEGVNWTVSVDDDDAAGRGEEGKQHGEKVLKQSGTGNNRPSPSISGSSKPHNQVQTAKVNTAIIAMTTADDVKINKTASTSSVGSASISAASSTAVPAIPSSATATATATVGPIMSRAKAKVKQNQQPPPLKRGLRRL